MIKFYIKSIFFWLVLLVLAYFNAGLRELVYKPILAPYIGSWAHQISSVTGILLFFAAIYLYLKKSKYEYTKKDLLIIGGIWFVMTLFFETLMNLFIQELSISEILETYYFWNGEIWIFVLLSLIVSPLIANKILKKK